MKMKYTCTVIGALFFAPTLTLAHGPDEPIASIFFVWLGLAVLAMFSSATAPILVKIFSRHLWPRQLVAILWPASLVLAVVGFSLFVILVMGGPWSVPFALIAILLVLPLAIIGFVLRWFVRRSKASIAQQNQGRK